MAASCDALVVGISGYHALFDHLQRSIPWYLQQQGVAVPFTFHHNFFYSPAEAWAEAQRKRYDLFFIDGALDNPVRRNRKLSECLDEYAPSVPLIGMSVEAAALRQERTAFDCIFAMHELTTENMVELLVQRGYISLPSRG